jgi:hypothetical protein
MRSMRFWDPSQPRPSSPGGSGGPGRWRRPASRHTPGGRRRIGAPAAAADILGVSVSAVIPLQSHHPGLILAATLSEIAALVLLIVTASLGAFVALLLVSVLLLVVGATNRRQVLALTSQGNVALAASKRGWPLAVAGPVDRRLELPQPVGLGQAVEVGGQTWWIDRSAFGFLRHAHETQARAGEEALLEPDGQDHRGEREDDRRHDGDAVQVALDHRGPGGRRAEAATEHLRESPAAPAVQQDQHDEGP